MLELFVIYKRLDDTFDAERCDYLKIRNDTVVVEQSFNVITCFPLSRLIAVLPVDLSLTQTLNLSEITNIHMEHCDIYPDIDTTDETNFETEKEPTSHEQENTRQVPLSEKIRSVLSRMLHRHIADNISRLSKDRPAL